MTIDARLQTLDERHKAIDAKLGEEMRRPLADEITVHDLKRQKLAIKDEITTLVARTNER